MTVPNFRFYGALSIAAAILAKSARKNGSLRTALFIVTLYVPGRMALDAWDAIEGVDKEGIT